MPNDVLSPALLGDKLNSMTGHASPGLEANPNRERWLIGLALFALYVIWGSTYLGIKYALVGFAPWQLNCLRFIASGAILYVWMRSRGVPNPTPKQFWNAVLVGVFLIIGGNGGITYAEHKGVASGIAATVVATMPLWASLWSGLWGRWPRRLEWIGMLVGLIGVAVLSLEGNLQSDPIATAVVFVSPMCWSFGSILSRRLEMPQSLMASATQMIGAGVLALPISLAFGERWRPPNTSSLLAFVYLVTFGSLIGYNAYIWLLGKVRPALATSYAYVNPVVAVLLGVVFVSEPIGVNTFIALPIILAGVGLVAWAQQARGVK